MLNTEFKVLLIDDDEDDFIVIRDLLRETKSAKFKLTWKSSYEDGLEALNSKDFDVCLLDFRLGEHSGLELLAGRSPEMCPIILLTGFGDRELDLKAMEMGAADYLVKEKLSGLLLERSIRYAFKRAQDMGELHAQKENFKTLFNSTFEGIFVYKDGKIEDANEAAGKIFGYDLGDMRRNSFFDFIRADYQKDFKRNILEGMGNVFEVVGVRKDESEIPLEVSSRHLNLKGENTILVAIRDLSQRKQMEEQILRQDRLASLGLLASSLAHEIGTPLGVIRGRAQFISDKSGDTKLKEDMGLITTQIDRIAKLVNSLLHLAREKKSSVTIPVSVREVLTDVTRLIQHELERNSVQLEVICKSEEFVLAEPGPLGQVFLNLLVNSFHAIEDAKRAGRKESHKVTINVNQDLITVSDTGNGIDEKNLKNIFKPFFTTKDIGVGTGLGLATSYKIVQSWNGSMDVASKIGQGTTFTIRLQAAK